MFLTKWVLRLTIIWLAQLEVVLNCNLNLCRSLEREIRLKHEASTWIRYVQQRSKPWNVFCIQALEPNSYGHRREIFIEKVFIVLHGYLTNFLKKYGNQIVPRFKRVILFKAYERISVTLKVFVLSPKTNYNYVRQFIGIQKMFHNK